MKDIASYLPAVPAKWVKHIAQLGLTSKGILYCLLGGLAFRSALALDADSGKVDRKSVFLFIEDLLFGRLLLGVLAVGLASFCVWRLLQALKDTESKGTDWLGLAFRLRSALSGGFYAMLALVAIKLAVGGAENGESFMHTFTALVVHRPLGQLLLLGVGGAIALAGAFQIYQGLSGKYRKKIIEAGGKDDAEKVLIRAGMAGYAARGIVWIIIGYLLVQTVLIARANKANTDENVFKFIENASYGSYLLGGVALGLICYGLFTFMEAKFRSSRLLAAENAKEKI